MRSRSRFLLLGLILALTSLGWARRPFQKAPDFSLDVLNGKSVQLSQEYATKPVLLIFWASWCPSCVDEIPEVNSLRKQYKTEELQILAVNVQESSMTLSDFVKTHRVDYPVLLDSTGEVSLKYKIEGLPVSVLLAKGGEILYYGFSLPRHLDELLGTRRVS